MGAGERVFELLDTGSDVIEPPNAPALADIRTGIRFEHVSFRYDQD